MTPKMQLSRVLLNKLPEHGALYRFYRVLKISRQTLHDWIKREGMPVTKTESGYNIIIKSEFIAWLDREGRIKD
jgi:hypothetical protein